VGEAYARFSFLSRLPLPQLERRLQILGSSPYALALYDELYAAAVAETARLAEELDMDLLPRQYKRRIRLTEPCDRLWMGAYAVSIAEVLDVYWEDDASAYETDTWDSTEYSHRPGEHWLALGDQIEGIWDVTALWACLSTDRARQPDKAGTTVTTAAEAAAGATSLRLSAAFAVGPGDVLYDASRDQSIVVAAASAGDTLTLDQWGTPGQTIPTASTLTYCGRLRADVERLVLLRAYLATWGKVTGSPEPSGLLSEHADRHGYTRDESASTYLSSVVREAQHLETWARRTLRPYRPL
jgi:hypothetical protein